MSKLISVIIPVYNAEKYLSACLTSVLGQSYPNLEVILIDDGSLDDSPRICDEYAKKDARVKVLHKQNAGPGAARNDGLKMTSGQYVTFVDSDDVIGPDMYECMAECMEAQNCDIVACGRCNVLEDGRKQPVFTLDSPVRMDKKEALRRLLIYDAIDSSPCDKLFRRDLWEGIEFPPGYISEDVAVMYLLFERAERGIYHCGKPFYHYYQRTGSRSRGKVSEKTRGVEMYHQQVQDYVLDNYPELRSEAEYFYVSRLPLIMDTIAVSIGGEAYGKEITGKMRKLLPAALRNPFMSAREKAKYVLIAMGIYMPIRRLYVNLKGY